MSQRSLRHRADDLRDFLPIAGRAGGETAAKIAGAIDGDRLLCSVTDNGGGFDPDTAPGVLQGHFGLQGVRERIDELGGEFIIRSACCKGSKATISALSRLMSDPEYDLPQAYVFNDKSWKSADNVIYLPIYMISLLKPPALPEKMIYKI